MMPDQAFLARSRNVAELFLHSAVIVDDLARLGEEEPAAPGLTAPGRARRPTAPQAEEARYRATHDLDAKALVDKFADQGIVCAVLRPRLEATAEGGKPDDMATIRIRTDHATRRADIVILDWNIPTEAAAGDHAKELIRAILETDVNPNLAGEPQFWMSRRLRLIAIYTGELDLQEIAEQLRELAVNLNLPEPRRIGLSVQAGPVRFVVYGKVRSVIEDPEADQRVSETTLPERLLDDFTAMTSGLLSNVALASLGAIRDNTHRILRRFNRTMDAPYIAHRAMTQPPEEAAEHPIPLVTAELDAVLADAPRILALVDEHAISDWLDERGGVTAGRGLGMESKTFHGELLRLLKMGLENCRGTDKQWRELVSKLKHRKDRNAVSVLSDELTADDVVGSDADVNFAILTSVRSQYDSPEPVLRLGTVVALSVNGKTEYRLCIQPLCDSVRIEKERVYPFLKLKTREPGSKHPFELVVQDGNQYPRLAVSLKVFDMRMIAMTSDPAREMVIASKRDGSWLFPAAGDQALEVRWVADLKRDFAQRIANRFATAVSRVGLTESEWLRRMALDYPDPR